MGQIADRVQETSTTTGTGDFTLAGAVAGFRTFQSAFALNTFVSYAIVMGTEWEVGNGFLLSSSVLVRHTVKSSSNAGALVNFSAGTKQVFCTVIAGSVADVAVTRALILGFGPLSAPSL